VLDYPDIALTQENGWTRIAIVVTSMIVGLYFQDLYSQFRVRSRTVLCLQFCSVIGFAFFVQALLEYAHLADWTLPGSLMFGGGALALVVGPAWRILYEQVLLRTVASEKILILGTSPLAQAVAARLAEDPHLGMTVVGYVDTPPDESADILAERSYYRAASPVAGTVQTVTSELELAVGAGPLALPGGRLLGPIANLQAIVEQVRPDRIVVGMTERRGRIPMEELLDLRFAGIRIEDVTNTYETVFGRVSVRELPPLQFIFMPDFAPARNKLFWHDLFTLGVALIAFVVALPVIILVAILVRVTSRGPVLYRQARVGKGGVIFTVLKFRSMYQDAEAATGAVWAVKDDPRITPLGRWIRKLRLDELPQLINVLRGDMSIVGPRPERPEFVHVFATQIPYYRQRMVVRPGITGWAQINYKYGDTLDDTILKLEYDLYYIKNLTFSLDVYIMFQTVKVMLLGRGAQ
jgi:lipopolysaccharide/colanic/teichoic acid biosynthesis glycosyltransferase